MRRLPSHPFRLLMPLLLPLAFLLCGSVARAEDDVIYPPAPAAKPFIDFDGRGFLIGGKRTFLAAGAFQYTRTPRALWRDRLLRIKRAGFNTIETGAFWNVHETSEGKWDFTGERDFDAYLKLIHALGLYAIVCPGPYSGGDWESGGLPDWLRLKPGIKVRVDDPQYRTAVDRWYEKIVPIVSANQIDHGGAVIMVQLENEYPNSNSRDKPNPYLTHLREKAVSLGVETPLFFSGLHRGEDPAGEKSWDSKGRTVPWLSTEFKCGWSYAYGALNSDDIRRYERAMWKMTAFGGNGYGVYPLCGGTNFGASNGEESGSIFDFGAAIGQTGDLRPLYYRFKRAAQFACSFADVLEDSENADAEYKQTVENADLRVTARKSPTGTIVFADNVSGNWCTTGVKGPDGAKSPVEITLAAGEILPIVMDYRLLAEVKIECAVSRILGVARQGDMTTLVLYSRPARDSRTRQISVNGIQPNQRSESTPLYLRFKVPADGVAVIKGDPDLVLDPNDRTHLTLKSSFSDTPKEFLFSAGKQKIRILALSEAWSNRTWFVDFGGKSAVICGPEYVGDVTETNGMLTLQTETPFRPGEDTSPPFKSTLYGSEEAPRTLQRAGLATDAQVALNAPSLLPWQTRRGDTAAQSRLFTADWKTSESPLQMGSDGDMDPYAWYRAFVFVAKPGAYTLHFTDAGDWLAAFANGQYNGATKVQNRVWTPVPRAVNVTLQAGENTVAILAAHYGRSRLTSYTGALETFDVKGLNGPVRLSPPVIALAPLTSWRWKPDTRVKHDLTETLPADVNASVGVWRDAEIGKDIFDKKSGFAWVACTLPSLSGARHRIRFESVDDNATVYLNGKKLGHHDGYNIPFELSLDSAWKENGPNEVVVLLENTSSVGCISGPVEVQSLQAGTEAMVRGWKMHGGLGDPRGQEKDWTPYGAVAAAPNAPAFFRTEFTAGPPAEHGAHPALRVSLTGLSRGFVWLNGHNLGRYPTKTPMNGLWLPDCWLQPGRNTLIIFDEEGAPPDKVGLMVEEASTRSVEEMTPTGP